MTKKTYVSDERTGERVPFLRGILVHSLAAAGISFEDAYAAAQAVRNQLADVEEINKRQLRQQVSVYLQERFGAEVRRIYDASAEQHAIVVRTPTREAPFSVGILSRYLQGCAIDGDEALECARRVHEHLREQAAGEVEHGVLRRIISQVLKDRCSDVAQARYLSRRRFENSGESLIVLIGGASGTGKSTITSELAYRLEIVRTQSTDMMREIIRCYLAPHVVPTLGYSSFEAWRGLPEVKPLEVEHVTDNPVVAGYLSQVAAVRAALEAAIARAVQERHDLIVDGVHVMPPALNLQAAKGKALVVPVMLAVTNKSRLARQLIRRGRDQPDRGSSRHHTNVDAIWELQSFMLNMAEHNGIPVVVNWNVEDTVRNVLEQVIRSIGERYPPEPGALHEPGAPVR